MPKRDSFKTKLDVIHFDPLSHTLHAHLLFYGKLFEIFVCTCTNLILVLFKEFLVQKCVLKTV